MASLGHQSLPPIDLGRVDEEMASPGGSPLQNFECKLAGVHALCHTGAEYHFAVWSSMIFVVSILGRSVLAGNDTGVVIQFSLICAHLEADMVILQAKVTCQNSLEHIALQQRFEGERCPVGKLS
ncbi:hypothetical protein TNCV_4232361 [Trichonephila clavipes]|nr:hypothetical protein TNCV_4232361 [Trichonephila clavipes]